MADTQKPMPLFDTADGESWRQRNPHLFRTATSLRWFHRFNKAELVERGAVSMLAGRWMAVEPEMTATVLSIAQRNAQQAVDNDAPLCAGHVGERA
jgi:hypothetical protein